MKILKTSKGLILFACPGTELARALHNVTKISKCMHVYVLQNVTHVAVNKHAEMICSSHSAFAC